MDRLCERPGCSEPSSVAYGMRPEDLVFWLDVLRDANRADAGVLCQRHADSMVVPRGWTLDDLRDPDLHLFRPPDVQDSERARAARSNVVKRSTSEQLAFTVEDDGEIAGIAQVASADTTPTARSNRAVQEEPPEGSPEPWTPTFDDADDLDGLLTARSPLLARAFRGAERPPPG